MHYKMSMMIVLLMFLKISTSFACLEDEACSCNGILLHCLCTKRENITMTPVHDSNVEEVLVDGCGVVTIRADSMTHIPLSKLHFVDIDRLVIESFAITGSLTNITLSGISDLKVDQYSFVDLNHVASITLHNVTAKYLKNNSFGWSSNVDEFTIKDSNFNFIDSGVFVLRNIVRLNIKNSEINTLEPKAFNISNVKSMLVQNTHFYAPGSSSLLIHAADKLFFDQCYFGDANSSFLVAKCVKHLSFENCVFKFLKKLAFANVSATEYFQFTNNTINTAEESSLFTNRLLKNDKLRMEVKENILKCDCELAWLWQDSNKKLFEIVGSTSQCYKSPLRPIDLVPIYTDEKCTKLELLNNTQTYSPKKLTPPASDTKHRSQQAEFNFYVSIIILFAFFRNLHEVTIDH